MIGTSTGGNFVKLLGLGKNEKEPYFEMRGERGNFIEGFLNSIELSTYEYEGKQRDVMIWKFKDEHGDFDLSMSFTRTSRSFLNCLTNVEKIDKKVRLNVYVTEKDGKIYKNGSLFVGGQRYDWKYSRDEQKKLIRIVKDPDTDEYIKSDYSKLDNKLKDEIKEINKRIVKQEIEEVKDDLPF